MPETAVDKYGNLDALEADIDGPSAHVRYGDLYPVSEALGMKQLPDLQLRPG
jgi:hypothetical protein